MTKANYMALADFQQLWTGELKPYILGIVESVEMDENTGDIYISYDNGVDAQKE